MSNIKKRVLIVLFLILVLLGTGGVVYYINHSNLSTKISKADVIADTSPWVPYNSSASTYSNGVVLYNTTSGGSNSVALRAAFQGDFSVTFKIHLNHCINFNADYSGVIANQIYTDHDGASSINFLCWDEQIRSFYLSKPPSTTSTIQIITLPAPRTEIYGRMTRQNGLVTNSYSFNSQDYITAYQYNYSGKMYVKNLSYDYGNYDSNKLLALSISELTYTGAEIGITGQLCNSPTATSTFPSEWTVDKVDLNISPNFKQTYENNTFSLCSYNGNRQSGDLKISLNKDFAGDFVVSTKVKGLAIYPDIETGIEVTGQDKSPTGGTNPYNSYPEYTSLKSRLRTYIGYYTNFEESVVPWMLKLLYYQNNGFIEEPIQDEEIKIDNQAGKVLNPNTGSIYLKVERKNNILYESYSYDNVTFIETSTNPTLSGKVNIALYGIFGTFGTRGDIQFSDVKYSEGGTSSSAITSSTSTSNKITVMTNVICQDGNGPKYNIPGATVSLQNGQVYNQSTDTNGNTNFVTLPGNITVRLQALPIGNLPTTNQPYSSMVLANDAINCSNGNVTKCKGGIPTNLGNFCGINSTSYEYCDLSQEPNPGQFTFKLSNCGQVNPITSSSLSHSSSSDITNNSSSSSSSNQTQSSSSDTSQNSTSSSSVSSILSQSSSLTNSSSSSNQSSVVCGALDVNNDSKITIIDFIAFASLYGSRCSDTPAPSNYSCGPKNSSGSGRINIADLIHIATVYGLSCK